MKTKNINYTLLLVVLFCLIPFSKIAAQGNSFVIDTNSTDIYKYEVGYSIHRDIFNNPGRDTCSLDIDQDGSEDFIFYNYYSYSGLSGEIGRLSLTSLNGYSFVIDTGVQEIVTVEYHSQNDSSVFGYIFSNAVSRLLDFDTIDTNSIFSTNEYIANYEDQMHVWIVHRLSVWFGQSGYIGFRKDTMGSTYYGWIKVKVGYYSDIQIIEYGVEKSIIGIAAIENPDFLIYPNPVSDKLIIENSGFETIKIYDLKGSLLISKNIDFQNQMNKLDVSGLSPGIYFLNLSNHKQTISRKFVKD